MPCYHPVKAWKSKEVNKSGKRSLVFNQDKGLYLSELEVPCGGCIGCRLDRARNWTLRLTHEAKLWEQKSFITLTYDDEHLPAGGTLVKKHHQDFLKRLRKAHGGKLKYFLCGEYGDTTQRPHYHAIIFGCDFSDRKPYRKNKQGDMIYESDDLDRIWSHGKTFVGNVTPESCGYVARYIMKKVTGDRAEEHYKSVDMKTGEIIDRLPEYINMSTRPAIGADFYEEFKTDFFPSDFAVLQGKKMPVPKYYDKKLEKEDPNLLEKLKRKRKTRASKMKHENTYDRLMAKETVKKAQLTQLRRDLC